MARVLDFASKGMVLGPGLASCCVYGKYTLFREHLSTQYYKWLWLIVYDSLTKLWVVTWEHVKKVIVSHGGKHQRKGKRG